MNYEVTPPKPFGMTEAEKKVRFVPPHRHGDDEDQLLTRSIALYPTFFRWKR